MVANKRRTIETFTRTAEFRFAGYVLDSGGYGLGAFLARAETLPPLPAAGRTRSTQSKGTAPPSGGQSNYLSQAHTQLSTFVVKYCIVLARYFLRVGPRATSTGLWRRFHGGSNFWILTLFGSGYAGLGLMTRVGDFGERIVQMLLLSNFAPGRGRNRLRAVLCIYEFEQTQLKVKVTLEIIDRVIHTELIGWKSGFFLGKTRPAAIRWKIWAQGSRLGGNQGKV